jgi:hypothetical protein
MTGPRQDELIGGEASYTRGREGRSIASLAPGRLLVNKHFDFTRLAKRGVGISEVCRRSREPWIRAAARGPALGLSAQQLPIGYHTAGEACQSVDRGCRSPSFSSHTHRRCDLEANRPQRPHGETAHAPLERLTKTGRCSAERFRMLYW